MADAESVGFVAYSYNLTSDRAFVSWLDGRLRAEGVATWFLDSYDTGAVGVSLPKTGRDRRYPEDWRLKKQNWHATYLRQLQHAKGIIVIRSPEAGMSVGSIGRGMWREAEAVDYIRC